MRFSVVAITVGVALTTGFVGLAQAAVDKRAKPKITKKLINPTRFTAAGGMVKVKVKVTGALKGPVVGQVRLAGGQGNGSSAAFTKSGSTYTARLRVPGNPQSAVNRASVVVAATGKNNKQTVKAWPITVLAGNDSMPPPPPPANFR